MGGGLVRCVCVCVCEGVWRIVCEVGEDRIRTEVVEKLLFGLKSVVRFDKTYKKECFPVGYGREREESVNPMTDREGRGRLGAVPSFI